MPISGCHDLPLATFNLPSRNNLQNKPNSAATMSLPCSRFATSAAATPVGCAAWRRRFRIFSFRYREMMSGMTMIFLTVMFFPPGILSHALPWSSPPSCKPPQSKRQQHPNHRHSGISRPFAPPQRPNPLVLPVHRRHACLAGPPANTCSRNRHQNKTQSPIVIPKSPPQGGLAFPSESRGDSFTRSSAAEKNQVFGWDNQGKVELWDIAGCSGI